MRNFHQEFIDKAKSWYDSEDQDYHEGVVLLLQMNRNRILHQNLIRKENKPKLLYEFKKWLDVYVAKGEETADLEATKQDVEELDSKLKGFDVDQKIRSESSTKGKREDHDLLPAKIQEKYAENLLLFPKMRSLHEKLKTMENERPCDRYPFLKQLVEWDELVRQNWDAYDQAIALTPEEKAKESETNPDDCISTGLTVQAVIANRSYLSRMKKKLLELKDDESKQEAYQKLKIEMQNRLNALIASNQKMDEKQLEELKIGGLDVGN